MYPEKKRIMDYHDNSSTSKSHTSNRAQHLKRAIHTTGKGIRPPPAALASLPSKGRPPSPSKLLANLTSLKPTQERDEALRNVDKQDSANSINRTVDFKAAVVTKPPAPDEGTTHPNAAKRDDRLALIEDLEPGPYEFNTPSHDPEFSKLEPHSGIRLRFVWMISLSQSFLMRSHE